MLAHLGEARPAIFTIEQGEECQHDRTPLFDHGRDPEGCRFPAVFAISPKWLRQRGKLFRPEPADETISRGREVPVWAIDDEHQRRISLAKLRHGMCSGPASPARAHAAVPGIHVLAGLKQESRGWPEHQARRRASRFRP
jgi:hypothetical protein